MLARDTTPIAPLMGGDENSIIQVKTENRKEKGDSVTFALLARLASDGFSEGQVAIANAEAMTLYSQAAVINEIGTACALHPALFTQRLPFKLRERSKAFSGCGSLSATNARREARQPYEQ